ncbi:MAG: ABC transporter ATP-binding protein [Candidatus Bathyarchaeia archaeon]
MDEVLKVQNLKKYFPVRIGFASSIFRRKEFFVKAVDNISFSVKKKEIFGIAGESGSGKTTTGRVILRLIQPTSGKVFFNGKEILNLSESQFKPFRSKMQIIFQDPYESLNPRFTIYDIVAEPLKVQKKLTNEGEIEKAVFDALESVKITPPEQFIFRYPHELSGGQRQRVAMARALVVNPEFIVADEPVSMLDVSIRAEVLNILTELKEKRGVSFLFITHDLALIRHICDSVAIMYLGKVMEMGSVEKVIREPLHPYTRALITAVPVPDPTSKRSEIVIKGEIPSPINPPSGCRFHTRCPSYIGDVCKTIEPELIEVDSEHSVACHLYNKR